VLSFLFLLFFPEGDVVSDFFGVGSAGESFFSVARVAAVAGAGAGFFPSSTELLLGRFAGLTVGLGLARASGIEARLLAFMALCLTNKNKDVITSTKFRFSF